MNVLLLGKAGGITGWTEDIAADLKLAGHVVTIVATRNPWLSRSLEQALLSPAIGAPLAVSITRKIRRLAPDLVLAVGTLDQFPKIIFEHIAAMAVRPPLIAWVGDVFTYRAADIANLFDLIAYTDTGMVSLHEEFGFRSASAFVSLGATRARRASAGSADPIQNLAFVAAPTTNRRELLAEIPDSISIFGPGWQDADELAHHNRDVWRIRGPELADIYARHMGALNIRHGLYVINGLNQRHFAPYIQGTPVVTDAQPDITCCFDPETEMLVYRDAGELVELYAALRREPVRAISVGLEGQRRVLAHPHLCP